MSVLESFAKKILCTNMYSAEIFNEAVSLWSGREDNGICEAFGEIRNRLTTVGN
jgi:hypothetical protein